ncbi:hypothetical protein BV898_00459 [Hypsibius exemplaris]|uniref:G-protein coupled receptors family 1 profile domain-containing protein n=1 Tax=Hypsibius exemplaris TaxID=2072580 RepID=A0A1W0XDG9_HYPEX|nr:hypothetical protein BV898_00459 [Hypsibius exemplaris]
MNTSMDSLNTTQRSNSSGGDGDLRVTFPTVLSLITFLTGTIFNGTLLVVFAKDRSLRTPFSVYLVNLLLANFTCSVILYPMDFISNLHSAQWLIGNQACTAYLYTTCVIEAGIFHCHLLIALNRMWAVVHPISYRSIHSTQTAVLLCLGTWVYIHLAALPEVVLDALYYRLPVETAGCIINVAENPLRSYDRVAQLLFYHLPHLLMLLSVPIICCARRRSGLRKQNTVMPNYSIHPHTRVLTDRRGTQSSNTVLEGADRLQGIGGKSVAGIKARTRKLRGFLLLLLLTSSVTICWLPIDVYYTMNSQIEDFKDELFFQVAETLFSLQTTVDPLIFMFSMKNLRVALRRLVHC